MSSPAVKAPVFDPAAIETLRTVAGDQGSTFVAEMAELFLTETTKALPDLQAGFDRGDWKAVTGLAHSLKSSAATLGAMRLSVVCRELEVDTKDGAGSARTAGLVASVFKEFAEATPALKNLK